MGQKSMIKPVPVEQWDPSLRNVVEDMNGRPLNVHALMANQPRLLSAWWDYRLYIVTGGDLEQRDCELVILRVASRLNCWYEWASHVVRGMAADLPLKEVRQVRRAPLEMWNERDAALLRAVDELVSNHGLGSETRASLAAHFTNRQALDIISVCGTYMTLGMMLNTWEVKLDDHVADALPDDETREGFSA